MDITDSRHVRVLTEKSRRIPASSHRSHDIMETVFVIVVVGKAGVGFGGVCPYVCVSDCPR